jgi:hypothetical protein
MEVRMKKHSNYWRWLLVVTLAIFGLVVARSWRGGDGERGGAERTGATPHAARSPAPRTERG